MLFKRNLFFILMVGISCLPLGDGFAQDIRQKLTHAQNLEKAGRWEAAQIVYEELYRLNPNDVTVFNRLKNVYVINQQYERALQIVEAQRQKRADPNLDVDVGKIYYKMGRRDEAMALWKDVLQRYPKTQGIYHSVASAMSLERLLDDAIDVYLEGRKKIGKEDLFILNLVNLMAYG